MRQVRRTRTEAQTSQWVYADALAEESPSASTALLSAEMTTFLQAKRRINPDGSENPVHTVAAAVLGTTKDDKSDVPTNASDKGVKKESNDLLITMLCSVVCVSPRLR